MAMNVVSLRRLREFWECHPPAYGPLKNWHGVASHANWTCHNDVKQTFRSADKVRELYVFDVSNFRIVADVVFITRHVYIKHVFTHPEYDKWSDQNRKG